MLIKHNLIGRRLIELFVSGRSCIPYSHNPCENYIMCTVRDRGIAKYTLAEL